MKQITWLKDLPLYPEVEGMFHEAINEMPMMDIETYKTLVTSISYLGLIDPIILYQDKIIDGRARYLACLETGILPRFEEWKGDDTALGYYIWSKNMVRSHFTEGQYVVSYVRCKDALDRYFAQFEDE